MTRRVGMAQPDRGVVDPIFDAMIARALENGTPLVPPGVVGIMIEGWDGGFARVLRTNAAGELLVTGIITPGVTIIETTTSQNLALAPLAFTTALAGDWSLDHVAIHFSAAHGGQTVTLTLDALAGAAFDTQMLSMVVPAGVTDLFLTDQNFGKVDFLAGNQLTIACTNAGLPASTINVVISTEVV